MMPETKKTHPKVVLNMRMVDGGRACIGSVDCPHCGKEHLTVQIRCGELRVFCGRDAKTADGWQFVNVTTIT